MIAIPYEDTILEEFSSKGWNLYELREEDTTLMDVVSRGPSNRLLVLAHYFIVPKSEFPQSALAVQLVMNMLEENNLYPPRIQDNRNPKIRFLVESIEFSNDRAIFKPHLKLKDGSLELPVMYNHLIVIVKELFQPRLQGLEKVI